MKKRLAFLLAIITAASFFAFRQPAKSEKFDAPQNQARFLSALKPQNVTAVASGVSPKVGSLADARRAVKDPKAGEVRFVSENQISRKPSETAIHDRDQNLAEISLAPMPVPSLSFEGITNRMNGQVYEL